MSGVPRKRAPISDEQRAQKNARERERYAANGPLPCHVKGRKRHTEKFASDPEYAATVRAYKRASAARWYDKRNARNRERIANDPVYRERYNALRRERYDPVKKAAWFRKKYDGDAKWRIETALKRAAGQRAAATKRASSLVFEAEMELRNLLREEQ